MWRGRSSLYAEYASYAGPPKHQGPPYSQRFFYILVSFWSLARGYENRNDHTFECSTLSPSLQKNQSNYVTWISYSLLLEKKKQSWKYTESWKRWALSASAIWNGTKPKDKCVPSIVSSQPHTPIPTPPVLRRAPRSLGSALLTRIFSHISLHFLIYNIFIYIYILNIIKSL